MQNHTYTLAATWPAVSRIHVVEHLAWPLYGMLAMTCGRVAYKYCGMDHAMLYWSVPGQPYAPRDSSFWGRHCRVVFVVRYTCHTSAVRLPVTGAAAVLETTWCIALDLLINLVHSSRGQRHVCTRFVQLTDQPAASSLTDSTVPVSLAAPHCWCVCFHIICQHHVC